MGSQGCASSYQAHSDPGDCMVMKEASLQQAGLKQPAQHAASQNQVTAPPAIPRACPCTRKCLAAAEKICLPLSATASNHQHCAL